MRKSLLFVLVMAAMSIGIAGCKQDSNGNSSGSMKMSTAMACCGDACKKMDPDCCKADDKGNVTCSMGGSCCVKTDKMKM